MKIAVIGAGPAGLYAGLLLKKANPAFDITIFERNPPGATYGWGVVFSDRTLNAFREADHKSYVEITGQFVIWDAIDLRYRGELIRCGGHVFAGMARRKLLLILQNRCETLGVRLKFETDVSSLDNAAKFDLIIGADGINSVVRSSYANSFRPGLSPGRAKYIWYGTHKVFDSFTFIFRENAHGLFQVHAYPFDGDTSTFIIECEEAVWQRAGLDKAGEAESLAYCEALFAADLDGYALLSNRSSWINFITVKNKSWRHQNIVLLGDAAHTAHFSIGSGTKLAMEDAIALANAFEMHGNDIETALKDYEAERRPRVELLQAAAEESLTFFENVKQYLHLEPMQFMVYLLTRSGRISYDSLRLRDPYFSDSIDRWFAAAAAPPEQTGPPNLLVAAPPMFTPLKLRGMSLANRVILTTVSASAATDGLPNEVHLKQLTQRARGGAALVMTEAVAVLAEGRITPGCVGLYAPDHIAAWRHIIETIHQTTGAKIALCLNHAGRRGSTRSRREGLDRPLREGNWPLLSASPLPYAPYSQQPKAADRADMDRVREAFSRAAQMAHEVGVDMLQLQFGHGYLAGSFISPLSNRREDDYGGSLGKRMRFPLEIFDTVRAAWPDHKPISVALNATDWVKNGLEVDEVVIMVKMLIEHGCDIFDVLAGQTIPSVQPVYGSAFLAPFSDQIRNEAATATITSGGISTTDQINSILAAGRADLCVMSPLRLLDD